MPLAKSSEDLVFFKYSGDISISGELSNELCYLFPKKKIAVAYIKGGKVNLSLRGKGIRNIFVDAINGFDGASGGGHRDAVGGQLQEKDLEDFRKKLEFFVSNEYK